MDTRGLITQQCVCVCVRMRVRSTRYVNMLPLNQAAVSERGLQVAAAAPTSSRWVEPQSRRSVLPYHK